MQINVYFARKIAKTHTGGLTAYWLLNSRLIEYGIGGIS